MEFLQILSSILAVYMFIGVLFFAFVDWAITNDNDPIRKARVSHWADYKIQVFPTFVLIWPYLIIVLLIILSNLLSEQNKK